MAHIIDLLDSSAAEAPDRVILRGRKPMTLRELSAATWSVAAWLRDAGLVPGDRLLIAAGNDADVIAAALGATRIGVTFTILHPGLSESRFRDIAGQVQPAAVLLDDATSHLRPFVDGLPLLPVRETGAVPFAIVRTDPVCLIFTSGSTGAPRGVMVSHDNVLFTTAAIQRRLLYGANDTIGLFLPLSFDYGLYQVFLALASGASLFIGEPADCFPLRLAGTLAEQQVSVFPAVPSLVTALVQVLQRAPRPLPHLRILTNTGERLPPESIASLRTLLPEVRLFPMYGLTECKRVSILLPEELDRYPRSVGRPLDGTTVSVVTAAGRRAETGEAGQLVVGGPHVTMGYWRMPAETARHFGTAADGSRVLFTGDTCRRDADGFLYFEGRDDAQIKRHGFRTSLLELESAALAVPGVAAAAAVHSESDELHLFVSTHEAGVTDHEVLRALRNRVEGYLIPDRIQVLSSLPTTPHGKVDRHRLMSAAGEAS